MTLLRDSAETPSGRWPDSMRGSGAGLGRFSWFIYRMNRPALRDLFMNPRNVLRLQEAMLSLLSGDVFRSSPVHARLMLFKALYYTKALSRRFGAPAQPAAID